MSGPPPWLYLDADGFFASCEEAADPRLHGRPVGVVAGSAYADAPLIAVNTVAKRAGVRSGDRVCEARKLCPGFAVRPQRVERYGRRPYPHGLRGRGRSTGRCGALH